MPSPRSSIRASQRLVKTATSDDASAVFFVDNHMRPYTGKRVVRKGWRMQVVALLFRRSAFGVIREARP